MAEIKPTNRRATIGHLILDDEMDSNLTLETVLQDNGFKVDSYEDHILALENFKSCFYDLAILDIKMPKMNGFLVYRAGAVPRN